MKDCWLIGDEFLGKTFGAFQEWHTDNAANNEEQPYLYEQYNVSCWNQSPLLNQPRPAHILNSFMQGLNSSTKLPKYVIIIPDRDLIQGSKKIEYGIICFTEEQLRWLFAQVTKAVIRRHDDLKSKRTGSLVSTYEPRIVWVNMIDRPISSNLYDKKVNGLHKCFNNIMGTFIKKERYMYNLKPELPSTHSMFTVDNKLSDVGKYEFWVEINRKMRLFDRHDIDLLADDPPVVRKMNLPMNLGTRITENTSYNINKDINTLTDNDKVHSCKDNNLNSSHIDFNLFWHFFSLHT